MNLNSILDRHDFHEHGDSADHWGGISNRSARSAYRMRMLSWILRIYCGCGGMPAFGESSGLSQRPVADVLGLPEMADNNCSSDVLKGLLNAKAAEVLGGLTTVGGADFSVETANWPVEDCPMSRTLLWLSKSAGLNPVEHAIFELAVALRVFRPMNKAAECWGNMHKGDLAYALSAVLNIPIEEVMAACNPKGALLASGIVRISRHGDEDLAGMLYVPRQLAESIAYHQGKPEAILAHMAEPLQTPKLTLDDFTHVQSHNRLAQCWLAGVLAAAAEGEMAGHLLVTGPPGLGKTEWSRALLVDAGAHAMEMVVVTTTGDSLTGEDRLQHLRMIMRMMRSTKRGVILFDEADDAFRPPSNVAGAGGGRGGNEAVSMDNHRASMNRLLEDSRIPVIWIMNNPDVLDPAVLRRFDVEIHFEGIPRSVRMALIEDRFQHRVTSNTVDLFDQTGPNRTDKSQALAQEKEWQSWGQVQSLTPALIDRLGLVSERADKAGMPMDEALCRHWLRQRLPGKATRHLRPPLSTHTDSQQVYDPQAWSADSVNASVDLMELVEGIKKHGNARIALSGAPGTGKTAFAKALARMLDKPLLEQRASDLLSPYVGETEQRISQCFDQAWDAVLFIDEVDGLLANRQHAARNWEVTQVNELLEQLGEFDGVVVVATNRMDTIDPAALRRLDIKIHFEALKPIQVRAGFENLCKALQLSCSEDDLQKVSALSGVTPGDFACIARRLGFAQVPATANGLIALLEDELALKSPIKQPMGFVGQADNPSNASGV
jgi:transitional endoplasmic reticulum ATPase